MSEQASQHDNLSQRQPTRSTTSTRSLALRPRGWLFGDPRVAQSLVKGIPKWFLGQVVVWRPGHHGPKNTRVPETNVFLALPPKAGKPSIICFLKMCGLQASKNNLAKIPLRDPFDFGQCQHLVFRVMRIGLAAVHMSLPASIPCFSISSFFWPGPGNGDEMGL